MTHSTNTLTLRGTAKWKLLSQQVQLMLNKGMTGNDVYHLFDRLPGYLRKDLHHQITSLGFVIDSPLVRINKNPDEPLPLGYSGNKDELATLNAHEFERKEGVNSDKEKQAFTAQFGASNQASTGLSEFAKKFGSQPAQPVTMSSAEKLSDPPDRDDDDDASPFEDLPQDRSPAKKRTELSKIKNLLRPS